MKGVRTSDNCYGITLESGITCNSTKLNETELWYKRLGHVNFNDLSRLFSSELIYGIPKLEKVTSCVCRPCQLRKLIKSTHKKAKQIATSKPFELVHMDLIGRTQIESIGGKKYIFMAVDDFSRFI